MCGSRLLMNGCVLRIAPAVRVHKEHTTDNDTMSMDSFYNHTAQQLFPRAARL
jgi:hypothetical protein